MVNKGNKKVKTAISGPIKLDEMNKSSRKRGRSSKNEDRVSRQPPRSRSVTPQPTKTKQMRGTSSGKGDEQETVNEGSKTRSTEQGRKVQSKVVVPKPIEQANVELAADFQLEDQMVGDHLGDNIRISVTAAEDDFPSETESDGDEFGDVRNVLNTSADKSSDSCLTIDNPAIKQLFEQWYEEKKKRESQGDSTKENPTASKEGGGKNLNNSRSKGTPIKFKNTGDRELMKSPSDTTIYAPGLKQNTRRVSGENSQNMIDQISNFVEEIRIQSAAESAKVGPSTSSETQQPKTGQAKEFARDVILEAEQFKATIQKPRGKEANIELEEKIDDEFFHIACHIDSNLRAKISKGEFVELEKLLPRDRVSGKMTEDNKMELVSKNGMTYFVPAADREKIGGVRKWEQAFRVYATIYSQANPHRSPEIWQYIHVINMAASSFIWDNVASYDFTFRQLMAAYPHRSWARTYGQYWNLCMRDPIGSRHGGAGNNNSKNSKRNRDNYCWTFNKNKCNNGANCPHEHRCLYCDGWGHGMYNCFKLQRRNSGGTNSHNGNNGISQYGSGGGHHKFAHSHGSPKGNGKNGHNNRRD